MQFGANPVWQQAQAGLAHGRLDVARAALARLRSGGDAGATVYPELLAAQIAWQADQVRDAAEHALRAAEVAPADFQTLCATANVLIEAGERVAASACLDRLPQPTGQPPLLLMHAAELRRQLEQHVDALALLDGAAAVTPHDPALRYARGRALIANGRLDAAEHELAASLVAAPMRGLVAIPLVQLRTQTPERNWLREIDTGLARRDVSPLDRAAFHFARYKVLEDLRRFDEAGSALECGNELAHRSVGNDGAPLHAWLDRVLQAQPAATDRRDTSRGNDGPRPIFILGMPRSGTTLLERMLGNHPDVAAAGELQDFHQQLRWMADARNLFSDKFVARLTNLDYAQLGRRYLAQTQWRARGKLAFTDKQPPNWLLVGAIHAALPRAHILHLVRDPIDTCFSNWRAYFGNTCGYSYDLDALATYFGDYQASMAHWRDAWPGVVLDVPYASLVATPEAVLARVFAFCDLAPAPGCSNLAHNAAPTGSPSAAQVRTAIRRDTQGIWRHYAGQLAPLLAALGPGSPTE